MTSSPLKIGGVPEHFNLPWHLAIESGAFVDEGISVDYRDFPGGTGAMTRALAEKELDIAIVLTEGAVKDILCGGSNRLVKVYVQSPLVWGIHVAADSAIDNIDQVQGQRYAISRNGSGSHLMAIVDSSLRGWETGEMKFEIIKNLDGARKALAAGEADVFFWERFMTQPLVDNGEFRRVGLREVPWPSFVASVRCEILESRAEEVEKALEVVQAQALALAKSEHAVETISNRYELKLEDTQQWFSHVKWHEGFDRPNDSLETVIEFLSKLNLIPTGDHSPSSVWHSL